MVFIHQNKRKVFEKNKSGLKTIEYISEKLDEFKNKRILVFGDLILDKYVYTFTSRISREAPVLILEEEEEKYFMGGAGSTLMNLHTFGIKADILTAVGEDEEGFILEEILKSKNISTEGLFKFKNYKTPLKTRILSGDKNTKKQQVLRVDRNKKFEGKREKFFSFLNKKIALYDAIIISDYNYNIVNPLIVKKIVSLKKAPPLFVDSRFRVSKYKSIFSITPNEGELFFPEHLPEKNSLAKILKKAKKLIKNNKIKSILVTRGSRGMVLVEENHHIEIPAFGSDDIVDSTGAGDSVIAAYTSFYTVSGDFFLSAIVSNVSGAIQVMKSGAQPVTVEELKNGIKKFKNQIIETVKRYSKLP